MSEASNTPSRPRLLDLFCGAGGAAVGYHRAGFEVVGVDIKPQPNYPFTFVKADALDALWDFLHEVTPFGDIVAIHASPPCQFATTMSNRWRGNGGKADEHVNLIPETRRLLEQTGLPWVIENVPGARSELHNPVWISGGSVGLKRIDRPRLFETNWPLMVPKSIPVVDPLGVYGKVADGRLLFRLEGGEAMGIDWMDWRELAEAIPPAYTELIGTQLYAYLEGRYAEAIREYSGGF